MHVAQRDQVHVGGRVWAQGTISVDGGGSGRGATVTVQLPAA